MAIIGQALTAPEAGWTRYDNNHDAFKYNGVWYSESQSGAYGGTHQYSRDKGGSIKFRFKGTGIRIITSGSISRSTDIGVLINGEYIESYTNKTSTSIQRALVYEKTNMKEGSYNVELIINDSSNATSLDAIDIQGSSVELSEFLPHLNKILISLGDNEYKYYKKHNKVADFSFDEASGNVIDSIDPSVVGTVTGATRVEGWNGEGKALSFNGTSNYVLFNQKVIPTGEISIKFRLKMANIPTGINQELLTNSFSWASDFGMRVWINTAGQISFNYAYKQTGSWAFTASKEFIFDNKWHDVIFTWDGTSNNGGVKLYIDDLETPKTITTSAVGNINTPTYNLTLGRIPLGSSATETRFFAGQLDNLEIYNEVINPLTVGTWKTSTTSTPTQQNFLDDGMEKSLFPLITEPEWRELDGHVLKVIEYTDNPAQVESIIETETEPYSIYDEFGYDAKGDPLPMEVLFYTDDPLKTSAQLEMTANYSPLDEIEGDFEVVTWVSGSGVTTADLVVDVVGPEFRPIVRLMSGGISATDKDNEWDKYLVGSTLDGTITAGDNAVWNWLGQWLWSTTTAQGLPASRSIRGSITVDRWNSAITSAPSTAGFRPVIIIMDGSIIEPGPDPDPEPEPNPIVTTVIVPSQDIITIEEEQIGSFTVNMVETYKDGTIVHTDITSVATYSGYDTALANVVAGKISALIPGETTVIITYEGNSAEIELVITTIPKPGTALYEVCSGLLLKDTLQRLKSNWIASPGSSFDSNKKVDYLSISHDAYEDTLLLLNLPSPTVAFQIDIDYKPVIDEDKGGMILWKNSVDNVTLLMNKLNAPEIQSILTVGQSGGWDFFVDKGTGFKFLDSTDVQATKVGMVLKANADMAAVDMHVKDILMTKSNLLTVANIKPGTTAQLVDAEGTVLAEELAVDATAVQLVMPRLELSATLQLLNEGQEVTDTIDALFHGGDLYKLGSELQVRIDSDELDRTQQNALGEMEEQFIEVKFNLYNPSEVGVAKNLKLGISQYCEKFGWTWVQLAENVDDAPGLYKDLIVVPILKPDESLEFWMKVTAGVGNSGLEPIQFNIDLRHD